MTIDEAIAKYKEITNTDANCPILCMRPCDKCVQEYKQVLEWLEELKEYKQKPEGWMWDEAERKGYNKAIDDFVDKLKPKLNEKIKGWTNSDDLIRWCNNSVDETAEQLRAGVNNGTDNQ